MLVSIALLFLMGMFLGWITKRLKLPALLGMLFTGILLGPHVLNLLDPSLLEISADLRKIALIIILTRAGLALNIADLKRVGRPAFLMCFLPACFEIAGMMILAPKLMGVSLSEAFILGTVIAAVSPAVIVPKMLMLMENGYGTKQSIPQMIMAGASVDDVFVIVLFTSALNLSSGERLSVLQFIQIPISIATGILAGVVLGIYLALFFKRMHIRDSSKVVILLSISFLLVSLEDHITLVIPFSGLLAVMSIGAVMRQNRKVVAKRLSVKYSKLWVASEVLLFVLVGATVDLNYVKASGIYAVLLIFGVLIFRMTGVLACMIRTNLTQKERLFCMIAYLPKATVQAAIGGIPLAMGLGCGDLVLTVAVLAILITAPLGAFGVDISYRKLLKPSS